MSDVVAIQRSAIAVDLLPKVALYFYALTSDGRKFRITGKSFDAFRSFLPTAILYFPPKGTGDYSGDDFFTMAGLPLRGSDWGSSLHYVPMDAAARIGAWGRSHWPEEDFEKIPDEDEPTMVNLNNFRNQ